MITRLSEAMRIPNLLEGNSPFPLSLRPPILAPFPWDCLYNHKPKRSSEQNILFSITGLATQDVTKIQLHEKSFSFLLQSNFVTEAGSSKNIFSLYSPNAVIRIFITINVAPKSLPGHPAHCMNGTKWKKNH